MAKSNDLEPGGGSRTNTEWAKASVNLGSFYCVVLGAQGFGRCEALPSLPLFLLLSGLTNMFSGVWQITFRLERADGVEPAKAAKTVGNLVILCVLLLAIWGATIVSPTLRAGLTDDWGDGEPTCERDVFICGVFTAFIPIGIAMVGVCAVVIK
jgi:hypothetical protein